MSLLSWSIVHNLARQLISALKHHLQYLEYLEYYHLFLEYEHVHPCNHVGTCRDFFKRWQLHHWSRLLTAAVACSLDLADAADVLKMQNDAIHFCRPVDFQLKQETSEASPQAIVQPPSNHFHFLWDAHCDSNLFKNLLVWTSSNNGHLDFFFFKPFNFVLFSLQYVHFFSWFV